MKLVGITEINGKIILKSGLRIGAGDTEMRIGGTDNPIIRHPHTLEPYIPGSSLKGKVRSLLEMRSGLMGRTEGKPVSLVTLKGLEGPAKADGEKILKLFGASGADQEDGESLGPTRVSFADCPLNTDWKQKALERRLPFTEVKSENTINRIKGTADPRFMERVPSETVFDFSVTLKKFAEDEDLLDCLLSGLKLLELDALGGCGSRGYGRVRFEFNDEEISNKFQQISLFAPEG
ncbi:MAG: type III-A CRISPR-associated RAMP protein Csm3 [Desulfobacca sp. 4484_104]|nr:MAG: type III-A CRISPR-associated RAMP protein Csm3 [Desulfobacca sp. 4484_104]